MFEYYRSVYLRTKELERTRESWTRSLTPIQVQGLEVVLKDKKKDFQITSENGGRYAVHSYLLNGLWPWFSTATSAGMAEEETKTLHLPYPKTWVEILINFFYGRTLEELDTATSVGLLEMAHIYDIPQLQEYITGCILDDKTKMDLETALYGWRVANISEAQEVQEFFVSYIADHVSKVEGCEASRDYTDEQSLALYRQAVKVPARERRIM